MTDTTRIGDRVTFLDVLGGAFARTVGFAPGSRRLFESRWKHRWPPARLFWFAGWLVLLVVLGIPALPLRVVAAYGEAGRGLLRSKGGVVVTVTVRKVWVWPFVLAYAICATAVAAGIFWVCVLGSLARWILACVLGPSLAWWLFNAHPIGHHRLVNEYPGAQEFHGFARLPWLPSGSGIPCLLRWLDATGTVVGLASKPLTDGVYTTKHGFSAHEIDAGWPGRLGRVRPPLYIVRR